MDKTSLTASGGFVNVFILLLVRLAADTAPGRRQKIQQAPGGRARKFLPRRRRRRAQIVPFPEQRMVKLLQFQPFRRAQARPPQADDV